MSRSLPGYARALAALACATALVLPGVARADTCSGLSLTALPPATVGTTPVAVAVGDFNRDGKLDAAVVNGNLTMLAENYVSIMLGDGLGGFTPATGSPIATAQLDAIDIATGDLDRDGILDLVVAFGSAPQAQVLRGLGGPQAGQFAAVAPFPLAAVPTRVYLADFTQDADLDLVVLAETGKRILLYAGLLGAGFGAAPLTNLDLSLPLPGESPSGAAILDFNRDGKLDLAVSMSDVNLVRVYTGSGSGGLSPGPSAATAAGPRDVVAGDVNRDGWPDLVTANRNSGNASVLRNNFGALVPETPAAIGVNPVRLALLDLNHDGVLDLAALDETGSQIIGALGLMAGPPYFQTAPLYPANLSGMPSGLAVGRFTADGRTDLVTALATAQVVVVRNQSGTPCVGTSFASAPRAYAAGDAPVSTAAADFDGDGRADLAVAVENGREFRVLKNVAGHLGDFSPPTSISVSPAIPTAVATADLDSDGNPDLVAATSGPDRVWVFRGNGIGGLMPGVFVGTGPAIAALVVGDFDGNGFPDVAAASEGSGFVYVHLGDGLGGLGAGLPTGVGSGPHALVAGFFNADALLDLAVANSVSNNVSVLLGNGNGTFTAAPLSPFSVGTNPQGIAAADIDGDLDTDLVTADGTSGTVSVLRNDGTGSFTLVASPTVPANPTAIALLDLAGGPAPDIAVTSSGARTLQLLTNDGSGTFGSPSGHPIRSFPRAITPMDLDADGRLDLAVPCRNADSVVVLLSRSPAPLLKAPSVSVGDTPRAIVSADFDRDGDLDLAVANQGVATVADDSVSLIRNDGNANFTLYGTLTVGLDPEAIVVGDFNRDGRLDLVLNASGPSPSLSIFFGSAVTEGDFVAQTPLALPGTMPDDLVAGDFDRDGDLDLAVCDRRAAGAVLIVRNDGSGGLSLAATVSGVGEQPTSIVAQDFDRDGDLDLAVGNDTLTAPSNIRILTNLGGGTFTLGSLLPLDGSDQAPLSLTAGDLDGDGNLDLVAAAFFGDRLHVYRNTGGGTFAPSVPLDAPTLLQFVTAADFDLDGELDLTAIAAGLVALRGKSGLAFEPLETWVAGLLPWAAAVDDFNRDGRPDAAVVNAGSDDVSLLLSTTCLARRLEITQQPLACALGGPPYLSEVVVEARDDGGHLAACATGAVKPSIAPGTGEPGAVLGPPGLVASGLALLNGAAPFTAANALDIDRAGRRYRLQFSLEDTPPPNLPPALSRAFTLGPGSIEILGPASFCAPGLASYGIVDPPDRWDSYVWTLDATPVAFTPGVTLVNPSNPLVTAGPHTLGLTTRLDGCSASAPTRNIYVGDLQPLVTLQILGGSSVCVDCIGGSAKAQTTGGGALTFQWGYRTQSGVGLPVPIAGENGDAYVLKGASFPGPGTYYVVVTTTPTCGSSVISDEWTVTVVAGVPSGEVRFLAASSRGTAASGQNQLLWVNTIGSAEEIRIRWDEAAPGTNDCIPPADLLAPFDGEAVITTPAPSMKDGYLHTGLLVNTAYCYSVFVKVSGAYSPGRTVKARPFDSSAGPVQWAYATGGTAVAPPTVSGEGILAMSNDRTVHALTRGSAGGDWPVNWVPNELVGVAHSRSPVVPFVVPLNGASTVLFVADDSPTGVLHAINARTGGVVWADQPQGKPVTGAPGGLFTQYSGIRDLLLVGTRDLSASQLRGLDLADGSLLEAYTGAGTPGPIGAINGAPAIDYSTNRVYFAARKSGAGHTLFCLEILPGGPPVFSLKWSRDLGHISGGPVLRGGRVYVGTEAGTVYSVNAGTGPLAGDPADDHIYDFSLAPAYPDGPVKGFLFPDRRNDDLIFATDTTVWSISDDGDPMTLNWHWAPGGLNPSTVLFWPGTNLVYVGAANGELYELDFTSATISTPPTPKLQVLGGGFGQVGAPSLDIGVAPNLLLVGSEPGVIYGVEVPFP